MTALGRCWTECIRNADRYTLGRDLIMCAHHTTCLVCEGCRASGESTSDVRRSPHLITKKHLNDHFNGDWPPQPSQSYYITEAPYVLHYGLDFQVTGGFSFDKHRHFGFNPLVCPPWDFQPNVPHQGGLFEHPPMPRELTSTVRTDGGTVSVWDAC